MDLEKSQEIEKHKRVSQSMNDKDNHIKMLEFRLA
jgi:hypothetical protein